MNKFKIIITIFGPKLHWCYGIPFMEAGAYLKVPTTLLAGCWIFDSLHYGAE